MISRYDPFREALSLRRAMDQLFEQSFVNPSLMPGSSTLMAPMDVCETKNGYEVDVALPGVRPEDIELTVDQNTLTIRGRYSYQNEHQNEHQDQAQGEPSQQQGQSQAERHNGGQQTQQPQRGKTDRKRDGHNWLSREIIAGSFERTITFPRPIDPNKIQTSFQNGILTIQLPISEASLPKRISLTGSQGQSTSSQGQLTGSQGQPTGSQGQPQQTSVGTGQKQQG